MIVLNIPFVPQDKHADEKTPLIPIGNEPWKSSGSLSCTAAFAISHYDQGIYLRFVVTEPFLRVKTRKINSKVHQDNCVEFFIAFGNDGNYYNFEFNCLGSLKVAYGKSRQHRRFLPVHLLNSLSDNICISMDNAAAGKAVKWEISIVLPIAIFCHSNKQQLSGEACAVNFAKCGDCLPQPHYLSWAKLYSPQPDFHQPKSFGQVTFAPDPHLTLV